MAFTVGLGTSCCNFCNKPIALLILAGITFESSTKVNQTPRIMCLWNGVFEVMLLLKRNKGS